MKGFGENKNSKKRDISFSKSNYNYVNNQLNLASNFFKTGNILLAEKIYSQLLKEGNRSYELLFSYDWPGNVRELENIVQRALVLCTEKEISSNDIVIDNNPLNISTNSLTGENTQQLAI